MRLRLRTSESQGIVVARVQELPDVWGAGGDEGQALRAALAEVEKFFAQRNRAAGAVYRETQGTVSA